MDQHWPIWVTMNQYGNGNAFTCIYRIFYSYTVYIFECGLHQHMSISDLILPTQPINYETAQRPDQHTGNSMPYSLRLVSGSLTSHRVMNTEVLSSSSQKTRKSNHLQMSLPRQHFLLSYLKTLSVGPAGVLNRTTSCTVVRCSIN